MNLKKIIVFVITVIFCFCITPVFAGIKISGDWFYVTDIGNNGDSKIIIDGKERGECKAYKEKVNGVDTDVHILAGYVTTKFAYGYLQMFLKPTPELVAKMKKAKGIKFKAMGDGKQYRFKLELSTVKDYNHFGKVITPPKGKYKEITIRFGELNQESWGQTVSFDLTKLTQIAFQTVGQPLKSIMLKVCDFELIE